MSARADGDTQVLASAKSGISERTGRDIEHNKRLDPKQQDRCWRTREDPFESVWESELVPMLNDHPGLRPMTLLDYLQDQYPSKYPDSCLRTLQRRIKEWRSLHGPAKDIIFRQTHEPGRLSLSDFTELKQVVITINGAEFKHLLYHFRLSYSGWSYMKVIQGGESYTALSEGLQEALWRLGGSTKEHRTDSLSAAFKNLSKDAKEDITARYANFCEHYNMVASRNNRGVSHENGSVESPHGHIKRRIKQGLLLRGSNDFNSIAEYQSWLDEILKAHNKRNAKGILVERDYLQPLPMSKTADYTEQVVRVSGSSTINIRRVVYTVPSRLQHETLKIRIYDDRLMCYLGATHVITLHRAFYKSGQPRTHQVDYRHVIESLVKKPQAFKRSQLRDGLLPSITYKKIWAHVDNIMNQKDACQFIVKLLFLAAKEDCEEKLGESVLNDIEGGNLASIETYEKHYASQVLSTVPEITISQHALSSYNELIF